ncbi:papain family cysteine protease [Cooperia oncophora]
MSDRLCIATNGTVKVTLSADDIMTCCTSCSLGFGSGCDGGSIYDAFKYFVSDGVVTGGDYGSMYGCRPYEIEPDISQLSNNSYKTSILSSTPPCRQACQLGIDAFKLPASQSAIQREIMKNGPVVAIFNAYQDFSYYAGGIYKYTGGGFVGNQAVKVIGWGKEGDTPYWLMVNSWGNTWGEKGLFRMIRGVNECNVEQWMSTGHVGDGKKA